MVGAAVGAGVQRHPLRGALLRGGGAYDGEAGGRAGTEAVGSRRRGTPSPSLIPEHAVRGEIPDGNSN